MEDVVDALARGTFGGLGRGAKDGRYLLRCPKCASRSDLLYP
jgi:hypothetical protein